MDHFSREMEQRFLARALNPGKIVSATQHLRECESCRENATEEPRAKFSVLSESEVTRLDELKEANRGDHLINGLLNLRAGLLDDAQDDFQSLMERPGQTPEGKAFLRRLIGDIDKLRE